MTAAMYLPWVRAGLVAAVRNIDPLSGALPSRATVRVTALAGVGHEASIDVTIHGPGDLTATDGRLVRRTDPEDGAMEVEPNYFCVAELPAPDLPWMFTPAAPNEDRLRPCFVLVVVPADKCSLSRSSTDRLPVLHIDDVSTQLPDLEQSHAWAHAQVESLTDFSSAVRPVGHARLLCPRKLIPGTRYIAAVVPAFDPGRLAGLKLPVPDDATMQPSWDVAIPGSLDLPAYHEWRFTTGPDGDFEALALRLKPVALTGDTVAGHLAAVPAQAGLPALDRWRFPGALGQCADPDPGQVFVSALVALVDGTTSAAGLPLPPPFYGRRHAAEATLTGTSKPWLRRLNLDPRYRSAAGLGTRLVQEHQEALMAAAWSQVGQVEAANALLRQAQLARLASSATHSHLSSLDSATVVQIAGPVLSRLVNPVTSSTVQAAVADSRVPEVMVSGAFRRALRPCGPLGRHSGLTAAKVLRAVDEGLPVVPPRGHPDGMVTIENDAPRGAPEWCEVSVRALSDRISAVRPPATPAEWRRVAGVLSRAQRNKPPCKPVVPVGDPLSLDETKEVILAAIDPRTTVPARARSRVSGPPGWAPEDPLTPIMATPRIDTPLARDLVALSSDLLLPGVSAVPLEAVSAVSINSRFIESLMVGANEEMMRELLWRGYPTDLRGTCLRRFWDRSGTASGPADDIPSIDETWAGELGTHAVVRRDQVVLIVRGELLRRYPGTVIYAARAHWDGEQRIPLTVPPDAPLSDPAHPERYPSFSGTIPPDIAYVGFDLPDDPRGDPDPALGRAGWFFVFQQPAGRTRFGLDTVRAERSPGVGAEDLSWPAVATTTAGYVDLAGPLSDLDLSGWGPEATSADLAMWCEQRPFRVCIHASEVLGQELT